MGAAASIEAESSKEDIINTLLPQYMTNPQKFDEIYEILVARAKQESTKPSDVKEGSSGEITEVKVCTQEIVDVLNKARVNPKSFIPLLEEHLASFTDDMHYSDKYGRENLRIRTREGKDAVEKCIEYLRRSEPVKPIVASALLEAAAMDHAKDLCANSDLMHSGSDGSSMQQRVERYGEWRGFIGENIDCGNRSAANAVMMMLIDDGVPSRVHRTNCLNPDFLEVGGAIGPHPDYRYCVVLDFATKVLAWSDVMREDIVVQADPTASAGGDAVELSEDFRKVLRSIPMDDVVRTIEDALAKKETIVTIDFKAQASSAVVSLKKGKTIRKLNVKWGT
jgi:uncharacterized protein YkwD